jgi:hypothetical protein
MHTENRRSSERITVRARFTLNIGASGDVELWSRNMSLGGVYLECLPAASQGLALYSKVQLTVHYGPGDADNIVAEIVHLSPDGIGLRFDRESGIQYAA